MAAGTAVGTAAGTVVAAGTAVAADTAAADTVAGTMAAGTAVGTAAGTVAAVGTAAAAGTVAADTAAADTDESVIVTERSAGTTRRMHSLQFPDSFAAEKSSGSRCPDHHIIKIHL
jgi:hypothetical protein